MTNHRILTRKYFFSVEGETEQWYIKHLENLINTWAEKQTTPCFCVDFDVKVLNPVKRVKGISIRYRTDIWHFCDRESSSPEHVKKFSNILAEMETSQKLKEVKYHLAYSNFAFDLWIVLHKNKCMGAKSDRAQYLGDINRAYSKNFENMEQYKKKENFESCLKNISIEEVKQAIENAKEIIAERKKNDREVKGGPFSYYENNPSLSVHECIEKILIDCKVLKKTQKGKISKHPKKVRFPNTLKNNLYKL